MRFCFILLGLVLALPIGFLPGRADPPALVVSAPAVKSVLIEVVSRQLAAFHAGDFRRAYTFAAIEIRSKYNRATFEQMVRIGFPILTRSVSTEFGPTLDDGKNGVVYVRVSDTQHEQLYLYSLKREGASWKIIGVSQREEDNEPAPPAPPEMPPMSA
jgi:hypothetical protein